MQSPHVLFLTQHYPPEVAATGQLLAELAEDLVIQGFRVTVLSGRPLYGVVGVTGRVPNHEWKNGVEVIRTISTSFSRRSILGRAANWLTYPMGYFIRGLAGISKPDVVVGHSAPPTSPPIAYLLARRWKAHYVLYVQDVYPHIAWAVGAMKNQKVFNLLASFNRAIYRRADAIWTLGDYMAGRLAKEGVPDNKITVVHNWADGQTIYPLPDENELLKKALGLAGRFVVHYSGNLGMAHDFSPIRKAIILLKPHRHRLAFLFTGGGARRLEMESFVEREGLSDFVCFQDYVTQDQLLQSLNTGDAMLLTLLAGTEGLVVPSKMYSYMAVGKPILAICPNPCEISDIIEENQCGLAVKTGEELAQGVLTMLDDTFLRKQMSDNARAAFEEKYERGKGTARLGEFLRMLIQESSTCQNAR